MPLPGLGFNGLVGQSGNTIYQIDYQGGLTWHITTNISAKAAGTLYEYIGLATPGDSSNPSLSPYFNGPFVGQGDYTGPGTANPINGASGYGTSSAFPSIPSFGFPLNQVGLNHLMVVEFPFEVDAKFPHFDARLFGDVAYNLEGSERAQDAAAAYAFYLANSGATIKGFAPQTDDTYVPINSAFPSPAANSIGLVYGTTCYKNAWEIRSYWQHVEQYALDPNLPDTDFFEGSVQLFAGNLCGGRLRLGAKRDWNRPIRICRPHQQTSRHGRQRPGHTSNQPNRALQHSAIRPHHAVLICGWNVAGMVRDTGFEPVTPTVSR